MNIISLSQMWTKRKGFLSYLFVNFIFVKICGYSLKRTWLNKNSTLRAPLHLKLAMINARSSKAYGKVVRRRAERKCRFTSIVPSRESVLVIQSNRHKQKGKQPWICLNKIQCLLLIMLYFSRLYRWLWRKLNTHEIHRFFSC